MAKVDKKVMEKVEMFNRGKITGDNHYTTLGRLKWVKQEQFWREVIAQGKNEEVNRLVAQAKEILECMDEDGEDLIDYSMIMESFVERYQDDSQTDVGLRSHAATTISYYALEWAEDADSDLADTLSELEDNWMWRFIFKAVVSDYVLENELAQKALKCIRVY